MPRPQGSSRHTGHKSPVFTSDLDRRPLLLRLYPDQVLRQIAAPVKRIDRRIDRLARDMLGLMRRCQGIGLAAPQAGLLVRVIVADIGQGPVCLVNPRLTPSDPGRDRMGEGCLSLPGVFVEIERQQRIEVRGVDPNGASQHFEVDGLMARVLQHEVDHLGGVLICDYADTASGPSADAKEEGKRIV